MQHLWFAALHFTWDVIMHVNDFCTVTLSGSGRQFRGFLIQARLMSDDTTRVGSFSNPPTGARLSSCSPSEVHTIIYYR